MAKLKQAIKVLWGQGVTSENTLIVYLSDNLVADLQKIEGISNMNQMIGCYMVFVDPRYDEAEVVREIESLDTPIPPAFFEDNTP